MFSILAIARFHNESSSIIYLSTASSNHELRKLLSGHKSSKLKRIFSKFSDRIDHCNIILWFDT
jgi:hypothetical protein